MTRAPQADEERARKLAGDIDSCFSDDTATQEILAAFAQVRAEQREWDAGIAEGHVPVGPDPIGPLHGAGWAGAAKFIAQAIRAQNQDGT